MKKTPETMNGYLKKFLILMVSVVVLVAIAILSSCSGGCKGCGGNESGDDDYLPKDYGEDPSGLDDDHTARY